MKKSYIVAIVTILFPVSVIAKYCDNSDFGYSSIEPFCTRENGLTADCRGSLYNVTKAYVKCKNGYYNEKSITLQELECSENGEWSDEIMECIPECVENVDNKNTEFPYWNLEIKNKGIISPSYTIEAEIEFFQIPRYEESVNDSDSIRHIQIPQFHLQTNLSFYAVNYLYKQTYIQDKNSGEILSRNLVTYCDSRIKNHRTFKPICFNKTINESIEDSKDQCKDRAIRKCFPDYDDPNVELVCFTESKKHTLPFKLTECRKQHDIIMVKCRLGTRIKFSEKEIFLGLCLYGTWDFTSITCEHICGQTDKDYIELQTPLVYKGIKTDILSFPWHVAIFQNSSSIFNTFNKFENICGGTIIHSNIIISAAHCFYNNAIGKVNDASKYLVSAGKNYRNYDAIDKYAFFTGIEEIHVAQNYYSPEIMNDISVLILKEHLTYSSHIKPACINFLNDYNEYFIKSGIEGYVPGWGKLSEFGDFSNELLTTKLSTLTMNQCKNLVNANAKKQIVGDKFCAVNENNSTACPGDSGGGFVVEEDLGYGNCYYLKGIVSSSLHTANERRTGYCNDGYLTVFTNIQFYQNFIKSVILRNQLLEFLPRNYVT